MSEMKTRYLVMCYPRHSALEVEYTGTVYEDPDEAKLEWIQAKEDPSVDTSWVETCCCPDNDDD